jgi:hypothetical protein
MKSPLKTIVVMAGVVIVSTSVIVIVQHSQASHQKSVPHVSELPVAISNYSKTFKLNTNSPIWPTPANGRSTTN